MNSLFDLLRNWLTLHPKVGAAIVVAIVLTAAGPQLKANGIDLSTTWQMILIIFASWLTPDTKTGGTQ